MKVNKKKITYYIEYTVLFLFFMTGILYFYYSQGKSMIDADGDGFRQHFRGLLYYSNYLKTFFHNLFVNHKFELVQWDFVLGEGSDVLKTLHYYCIGDVFTFFSFLCPEEYMYLYYDLITVLRIYFSGISFSRLCLYKKKDNVPIVLLGALLYAFCPFSFSSLSGHVFFISGMVWLPLIILGVEKVIYNDKPYTLILSVFFASMSNIYFFYINVLSTVIFVIVRILLIDRQIKERVFVVLRITLYSFVGVLMGAIVFLPMLMSLFGNSRLDNNMAAALFYSLEEYSRVFISLSSSFYSSFGGYSLFWIFAFVHLLLKDRNKTLIALTILSIVFIIFPFFSKLYNGMIYPSDRWCYVPTLVFAYQIVHIFNEDEIKNSLMVILICSVIYYGLCFVLFRTSWQVYALYFAMTLAVVAVHFLFKNKKLRSFLCLLIFCACLSFEVLYNFSMSYWGMSKNGTDISFINDMSNDEHFVFDQIEDDDFYRYSGDDLPENQAVQGKRSSTQYYWSIINNDVARFRKDIGMSDRGDHHFDNYDGRFNLNAMASVRYFIYREKGILPYGFEKQGTYNEHTVYKSGYDLPLIYGYDNYILYDDWKKLDIEKRSESLLETAVLNSTLDQLKKKEPVFESVEIASIDPEKIKAISVADKPFETTLTIKNDMRGEYYIVFEGLDSKESCNIDISFGDVKKTLIHKGRDNDHYMDRHDYMLNLGYFDGVDGEALINLNEQGNYTCSKIRVVCQPLEKQLEYIEQRKEPKIEDLTFSCNTVSANVSLPKDKLLCFSIPYSKGWKAFVDGEEVSLISCNVQYMGLFAKAGEHQIALKYSSPLLKEGFCLSILGTIAFLFIAIKNKRS